MGRAEGAVQSHRAELWSCAATATMHLGTADDVVVTALPTPHVYGNVVINGTFGAGGTVVLMERFRPGETLRLIAEHRATLFEGVPARARRNRRPQPPPQRVVTGRPADGAGAGRWPATTPAGTARPRRPARARRPPGSPSGRHRSSSA
ncbi:MAG: AMP-binding protein [Pseudonocardia sp.]|nr:AMP-binding protein [Pseudonocardia sp.]